MALYSISAHKVMNILFNTYYAFLIGCMLTRSIHMVQNSASCQAYVMHVCLPGLLLELGGRTLNNQLPKYIRACRIVHTVQS